MLCLTIFVYFLFFKKKMLFAFYIFLEFVLNEPTPYALKYGF